jgi:uridine phosphorylase
MSSFAPSELILNDDGSIYHLHLQPDQIADTIFTVGDPARVERISQHFDRIEHRVHKREFITHTGSIGHKRLTVISTGIGPDNIDIVLNELDALANIDLVSRREKADLKTLTLIRIGTSGALQADIEPGQRVASTYGLGFDNLLAYYDLKPNLGEAELITALNGFQAVTERWPVQPYAVSGSPDLIRTIGKNMLLGITITSPGFYGPQGRSLRLKSRLTALDRIPHFRHRGHRITNFEMETSAIYGLSRLLGHRALSCNVILANRARGTFSSDAQGDVDRLIREVLERVLAQE